MYIHVLSLSLLLSFFMRDSRRRARVGGNWSNYIIPRLHMYICICVICNVYVCMYIYIYIRMIVQDS